MSSEAILRAPIDLRRKYKAKPLPIFKRIKGVFTLEEETAKKFGENPDTDMTILYFVSLMAITFISSLVVISKLKSNLPFEGDGQFVEGRAGSVVITNYLLTMILILIIVLTAAYLLSAIFEVSQGMENIRNISSYHVKALVIALPLLLAEFFIIGAFGHFNRREFGWKSPYYAYMFLALLSIILVWVAGIYLIKYFLLKYREIYNFNEYISKPRNFLLIYVPLFLLQAVLLVLFLEYQGDYSVSWDRMTEYTNFLNLTLLFVVQVLFFAGMFYLGEHADTLKDFIKTFVTGMLWFAPALLIQILIVAIAVPEVTLTTSITETDADSVLTTWDTEAEFVTWAAIVIGSFFVIIQALFAFKILKYYAPKWSGKPLARPPLYFILLIFLYWLTIPLSSAYGGTLVYLMRR
ncbi:MAG: hypothetical protein Q6362_007910 [Candidatus Wukongarchaeota archaeon]|nr:hypothetical protein [Candidatus Wukongarchaeota archaeon]MDO8129341.1 hypothetical protein [Candidatus Wukongarchaeota archaeon]